MALELATARTIRALLTFEPLESRVMFNPLSDRVSIAVEGEQRTLVSKLQGALVNTTNGLYVIEI